MPDERPRVRAERVTDSYAIAVWRRLVLWVVDGHTPVVELERLRTLVHEWSRGQSGEKNVTLVLLHASRSTMEADERRAVLRMIDETKHDRVASATVVLARGMIGALHRSILTGFSLLLPPPHPTRVFGEVPPAIAFLHGHIESLCGAVEPLHIEAMLDDLHAEILRARAPAP